MADLHFTEKRDVEVALDMGKGYVLDFSNNTFADFIADSVRVNIYGGQYSEGGTSKANHLRTFFAKSSNYLAGCLLHDLIEYAKVRAEDLDWGKPVTNADRARFARCLAIADRWKRDRVVENVEYLKPNAEDEDFTVLAGVIRESLEKNQPQVALDRLHTFCVKYFRNLCTKHEAAYLKDDTLGNLVGKYVKKLETEGIIQAKLTVQIMKSSISIFSDFNHVRNNQSFAHDNPLLNYEESLLIFNNVANTVRFIEFLEQQRSQKPDIDEDDLDSPF